MYKNKIIVIIPARYNSSRFPGKPLEKIIGKPMIQWVFEGAKRVGKVDEVYVATDDIRIFETVESFGGNAIMTSLEHTCGTDRLAEASEILGLHDEDIILNIQGDEPLVSSEIVELLIQTMEDPTVSMGTLKHRISDKGELINSNVVKVVCNNKDEALYFSRAPIPFARNKDTDVFYYKHVGVYAYKKKFLIQYSKMDRTTLEMTESLEQLRVLENGFKIKVLTTDTQTIGVDTKEQIQQVECLLKGEN